MNDGMRIVIITQNEPFFLSESLNYLFQHIPRSSTIVGCVLLSPFPFSQGNSFFQKAVKTLRIFGLRFFAFYTFRYIINSLKPNSGLRCVLKRWSILAI